MDERLERTITSYAAMVLEWLDIDATENNLRRSALVEQFIDTLQALDQWKGQED